MHGQYAIEESNEATIVLGGVSGLLKGTFHFGMSMVSAAQDGLLVIIPGISPNTQIATLERAQIELK